MNDGKGESDAYAEWFEGYKHPERSGGDGAFQQKPLGKAQGKQRELLSASLQLSGSTLPDSLL